MNNLIKRKLEKVAQITCRQCRSVWEVKERRMIYGDKGFLDCTCGAKLMIWHRAVGHEAILLLPGQPAAGSSLNV